MKWRFENGQPIYLQIVSQMKMAMIRGQYSPGSRIPSVRDLAVEAGVNPNTVQRALSILESEQLIVTQRTSGKSVTEDAERILALRSSYCHEIVHDCITRLEAIGLTQDEIAESIATYIRKGKDTSNEQNYLP
ncbi:MAG: GntR family transcriptional regulator [Clostridia bacterium]|nr:GntR family transcriptional regulator [Clostridia bacterium]